MQKQFFRWYVSQVNFSENISDHKFGNKTDWNWKYLIIGFYFSLVFSNNIKYATRLNLLNI